MYLESGGFQWIKKHFFYLGKKSTFLPHATINEVKKEVGKTQQSIYSKKTADKVEKVNKTTYLPVENQLYSPQILMFFPRIVYFSSVPSEKYNNPLEKHQNSRGIKLYFFYR